MNIREKLEKLRNFYKDNDRLPSLGEAAKTFNYSSRNTALYTMTKLTEAGYIKKKSSGKYITTSLFHNRIRILGSVAAGFPTPEEEELRNSVSLDEFLIDKPSSTYMLEVKGDSMIEAGIMPGDHVLVEKGRQPNFGDIVIANVDGEWTMKYYRRKDGKVCLEAANPNYSDIYPQQELSFAGVVVSVCRKY